LSNGVDASEIIEISFEKYEDERYKDQAVLHERVKKASQKGSKLYLLIDEIQEMAEWAKTINSLHTSFNIDIYLTGSNARIFSGEHLTYLAGRYLEIKVYPLSFSEYLVLPAITSCAGKSGILGIFSKWQSSFSKILAAAFPLITLPMY